MQKMADDEYNRLNPTHKKRMKWYEKPPSKTEVWRSNNGSTKIYRTHETESVDEGVTDAARSLAFAALLAIPGICTAE